MNKFLLAAALSPVLYPAYAAPLDDAAPLTRAELKAPPLTVVLPTALQHERRIGWNLTLGNGRRMRLGLLSGRGTFNDALPFGSSASQRYLAGLEFEQKLAWGFANVRVGTLRQTNPMLRKLKEEASPWTIATRTAFSSATVGYDLTPALALVGMASFGRTGSVRNATMDNDATSASAAALSVGLLARDLWRKGDRAGVALVSPTRGIGVATVDGAPSAPRGVALGLRYGIAF